MAVPANQHQDQKLLDSGAICFSKSLGNDEVFVTPWIVILFTMFPVYDNKPLKTQFATYDEYKPLSSSINIDKELNN